MTERMSCRFLKDKRRSLLFYLRESWKIHRLRRPLGLRPLEGSSELGKTFDKSSLGEEELALWSDAHEAVEAVGFAGAIVAELSSGDLVPLAIAVAEPLVSVVRMA